MHWLALTTVMLSAPVIAETGPRLLEVRNDAVWKHRASGLSFSRVVAGLPRTKLTDFSDAEWAVAATYQTPDGAETMTVYVYQAATQSASLWFAEAQKPIVSRVDSYGKIAPLAPATTFAPRGDPVASALRIAYNADGPWRSTALAIAPVGTEWIVKVRFSAKTLTAAELDARLSAALADFDWPKRAVRHAPARVVVDCVKTLPTLQDAKLVPDNTAAAIFGGLMGSIRSDPKVAGKNGEAPLYCRDAQLSSGLTVYRPDSDTERYLISLGDSGRAVIVEQDTLRALLDKADGADKPNVFSITLVMPGRILTFPSVDRLPPPSQAMAIADGGKWLSETKRDGKNSAITVNADTLK